MIASPVPTVRFVALDRLGCPTGGANLTLGTGRPSPASLRSAGELPLALAPRNAQGAPIPAVRMTIGSARVDPTPTLTAARDGLLTALTLTAMGRLPKVLPAISQKGDTDAAAGSLV